MTEMQKLGARAKQASYELAAANAGLKNAALCAIGLQLTQRADEIIAANSRDIAAARENGMSEAMIDRLTLTRARMEGIVSAVNSVALLEDPIGEVLGGITRPNGLRIVKTRVPMGVIGIIFEARPNVTVDAAALCLKSGNACILRGGKEAIHSNTALASIMRDAIAQAGLPADCILLVEDTSRESANEMMRLSGYLDVLIPRGGAGLIKAVVENSTVPVIETGTGNCHVYVDYNADPTMAADIIVNAKAQRPSVCNAAETLLVHKDIAPEFLPLAAKALAEKNVKLLGCERTRSILTGVAAATEEDYATEFLDYVLAIRVVEDVDEAIAHIARYSTRHSECIVTQDYKNSQKFMQRVDAAAVYINASTRFTDGGEFGLGAEIGISTQKLHARGPMGLREMTTYKYLIYGEGQIR
ncbi:glutamate-5-semialdehyde dehydrogenase [Hydrogenoanaerobacterium sp.]|uniref:glutamate-5-semialdehyde dehydrogenase n=1 Tax=Hydrogenoanaerobacterium sp. TaxID=2953763 RepID=UPI002897C33B|nr:glutamate-5-semialdehyde dehydrogenase [Hydrogenoanaerobacterium sp.]